MHHTNYIDRKLSKITKLSFHVNFFTWRLSTRFSPTFAALLSFLKIKNIQTNTYKVKWKQSSGLIRARFILDINRHTFFGLAKLILCVRKQKHFKNKSLNIFFPNYDDLQWMHYAPEYCATIPKRSFISSLSGHLSNDLYQIHKAYLKQTTQRKSVGHFTLFNDKLFLSYFFPR